MSVIGEFSVPASALAMEETLAAAPGTTVEVERVVAHQSGSLTPYFWVRGDDMEAFATAIADDPSVSEVQRLDVYGEGTLYRAEWPADVESVGAAYLRTGGTILEATGRNESWGLRIRFQSHDDISRFYEYCEHRGIPFEVLRVYNPTTPKSGGQFGVTPKQREALVAALEAGFYEVPRDASTTEIAESLGISQQALSKRLRRGHGNIVRNALTIEERTAGE